MNNTEAKFTLLARKYLNKSNACSDYSNERYIYLSVAQDILYTLTDDVYVIEEESEEEECTSN